MSLTQITNCHIHTFTSAHVPQHYPHPLLGPLKRWPKLVEGIAWTLSVIGQEQRAEVVGRLARFQRAGLAGSQQAVLKAVLPHYPKGTRFVVLPMDMAHIGFGAVKQSLVEQHNELADMASDPANAGRIVPFATIYPDAPGAVAEFRRAIDVLGFGGLKLYPRLGFAPDHPVLMQEVYPYLVEQNLPVMSHCSRGGVQGAALSDELADRYTDPRAFLPVLEAFPTLRVCLAHFGGQKDWNVYVNEGIDPDRPEARDENWVASILDMIRSGNYPGLWTDISYTIFHFDEYIPFLKVFLRDEKLRARILFGSDYYMTRQEKLSERAVSFRLRDALDETVFARISQVNPAVWLGEQVEPTGQSEPQDAA